MSKQIHLTYCGMDGSGPTVKEAKLDATRKIESAIRDQYRMGVIGCLDGTIFIVHGGLRSGSYDIAAPDRKHTTGCHARDSFDDACVYAARHAADAFGISWWNGISDETIENGKMHAAELDAQRKRVA